MPAFGLFDQPELAADAGRRRARGPTSNRCKRCKRAIPNGTFDPARHFCSRACRRKRHGACP